jgi:hypothetical protein
MDTHSGTDHGLGSHLPHGHGTRGMYMVLATVWIGIVDMCR